MGNPLSEGIHVGTIGELFVQLRLFEFGIQSAPPIKDSGNDLIAIKGEIVKFVQVKTTFKVRIPAPGKLPNIYHIVALVKLQYSNDKQISFDKSKIFVYKKGQSITDKKELTQQIVNEFWSE